MRETKFKQTEIGKIPEDWNVKTIDDIKGKKPYSIAMGPFGSNITKNNFLPSGVPVIRGANLNSDRFNEAEFVFISEAKADSLKSSNAFPKDIVITHRGTLGQVGIIPVDSKYNRYVVSQSQMKLSCDESIANPDFVFYFLRSSQGQYLLLQNTSTTGVPAIAQPLTSLKKIPIPLPDLEEQEHIASILVSLDDKIALNRHMNITLEKIGQALFRRWFVDFEFPDEEGKPYRSSGGEMLETELGEVPKGWKVMTVGEILELAYGKPLKDENRLKGNVPVYGSNGQIGWHNEKLVEGPGIVVGRKGNPGIITWSHKAFFPIDTTFYVVPKAIRSIYYLFYILRLQDLQSLGADSAVPGLNRNVVYMNKMIVPSPKILQVFDEHMREIYNKIQANDEQSRTLAALRDALLPKLMSGEIRVSTNSNLNNENK
ncbi:MAG: restriction endonuclease subunit S [Candidatus Methanoperedens sp.]|nr:restriction endonuclease subunit S [Candidatus Methanoperedens sp.]MCZ7369855.1 restriction endonuclease subunit S [Candidatus Methanoperedens sp.]